MSKKGEILMKKKFMVFLFTIVLALSNTINVFGADLSTHEETEGSFTPVYAYKNPFQNQNTSSGVQIRFHAVPNGDLHILATIFALHGSDEYDGRLFFTPASYLGMNIASMGYWDANLVDYLLVEDFIKEGAEVEIAFTPNGFTVTANGTLCYDQTILEDPERSSNVTVNETFSWAGLLDWFSHADTLYFGYGSFWNSAGYDESNMELTDVFFELANGTTVGSYFTENEVNEPIEIDLAAQNKVIDTENSTLVEVNSIDISYHGEQIGDFTPLYTYSNPFLGKDTSNGVAIEFTATSTGDIHPLGTIFSICGTENYDGRLYFTPASYLGFNSPPFGGYFDANLKDYLLVEDFIGQKSDIHIELTSTGFKVYANGTLCYDQTILGDETKGNGDYTPESDFSPVLNWLSGAETLYLGYGSWWNSSGYDEANILLSNISFQLLDGTQVASMKDFKVYQSVLDAIEEKRLSLEEEEPNAKNTKTSDTTVKASPSLDVNWDDVEYTGTSIAPLINTFVGGTIAICIFLIVLCSRKKSYPPLG